MQADDFGAFNDLMTGVYSFYSKEASSFSLDVWWHAMKPYDFDAVRDALGRHCVNPDSGQFLPKPADVVKMLEGSTLDSAVLAWTKVDAAVQRVGTYTTVVFDDALIHRVLDDMGGWIQMGTKTIDEWPFVAKEFQQRYRGYKARRVVPEYPPKLLGIIDRENSLQGYALSTPVLIGIPGSAQAVLAGGSNRSLIQVTAGEHAAKLLQKELA
jgi:hypothetical protein